MSLKFIASGDTILTCYHTKDYAGYRELSDFIHTADVRMNNMETPLLDHWTIPSAFSGGHWLRSPTSLVDEMTELGFNCFCFANNHNLDFFYTGLASTLEAFRSRGVPVAGAGEDLDTATRHCKVETDKGSVALLALTCTGEPSAIAGPPSGEIPGRPGVSMLRYSTRYYATAEQLKALEEIADATLINGTDKNRRALGSLPTEAGVVHFGPLAFSLGEPGRFTTPNSYDMERLEKAVKAAVADADRTVVYVHSHEIKGDREEEPDYFVETFSRACIDWGADAVICSGTHQVKAVEIYGGKPIFYSIANFFYRPTDLDYYPWEWYEKYKLDKKLTIQEAENVRSRNGTIGLATQAYSFRAMLPFIEWDDAGNCTRIAAMPISLGFHDPQESKGFPRIAGEEDTRALYEKLRELCGDYGTKVTMGEDGMFEFTKA